MDRAALDAAITLGLPYGGSIPKGRKAEDGPIDERYQNLTELTSSRYEVRTRRNVLDADATLIICDGPLSGGTGATLDVAIAHHKPYLVLHLENTSEDGAIREIRAWLE